MKLKRKLEIDLKDFILNGKFDFVELGQTIECLKNELSKPDDHLTIDCYTELWRLGTIELHFFEKQLCAIFCDEFRQLKKSKTLKVEPWVIQNFKKLSLDKFLKILNKQRAGYSIKFNQQLNNVIVKINKSQVVLYFEPELGSKNPEKQNPNHFLIKAFGLSNMY